MRRILSIVVVLGVAAAAACADAGGDATGGAVTPGGQEAMTPGSFVSANVDAGTECGSGTTWSSIYKDIMGPTGRPGSCSFLSSCHGSPDGEGAQSGAGIQCYDQASCRASILSHGLVQSFNKAAPLASNLLSIMRRTQNGVVIGIMPKSPGDYVFPDACIDRISGWIANGFPDD